MHIDADPATTWLYAAAQAARDASDTLAVAPASLRASGLAHAAGRFRAPAAAIQAPNPEALAALDGAAALRDRVTLNPDRVEAMARGLDEVAALADPLDRTLADWTRPNGLRIRRVAAPIGVIGMVYESRPNVGADAAALCVKSGNAVILRGGSDSLRSARAIHAAISAGLREAGLPEAAVQVPPSAERSHVAAMLAAAGQIDLIIPRGGKSLVERVRREARVPVLAHAEGLCHTYVHAAADPAMARAIVGSATRARAVVADLPAASETDFHTEWLGPTLSIAVVDGVADALAHIRRYGSEHTEAIVTEDAAAAGWFLRGVGSAVALWNASPQFCDGAEFGFGAEIGIATGRVHARGPVGLEQLTTFRYLVTGSGQVRP